MARYLSLSAALLVTLMAIVIQSAVSLAQWVEDGIPICMASGIQNCPQLVFDGDEGVIIVWDDYRHGNWDIYAQKIDTSGAVLWDSNGVAICTASGDQRYPRLASDGAGGATIAWQDGRGGSEWDIYTQSVNSAGTVQWTVDGVAVCTATGDQKRPELVSHGVGGAMVVWEDFRDGDGDIFAQAIDGFGTMVWDIDGMAVCSATGDQENPRLISNQSGGAIVTWEDYRYGNGDIYAQGVSASGTTLWGIDGVSICGAPGDQSLPQLLYIGIGGAIITWMDWRIADNRDIYAQLVDSSGSVQWSVEGVPICTAPGNQYGPELVSDGSGGAIIAWGGFDIYAQKIDVSGTVQWTPDGVAIYIGMDEQWASPRIVSDGVGGSIITWPDYRNGYLHVDIYANRVDASGAVLWNTDGVPICTAPYYQACPQLVSNGSGGAIIAWEDYRGSADIYAQQVDHEGHVVGVPHDDQWSQVPQTFSLSQNYPNPFNPATEISYALPRSCRVKLEVYNLLGERVATLVDEPQKAGYKTVRWKSRNERGEEVAGGIYLYRLRAGEAMATGKAVLLR